MLLNHDELRTRLLEAGVPLPRERLVGTAGDAVETAVEWGVPVACKLVTPALVHKSDVGGVLLDLATVDAVEDAAGRLTSLAADLGVGDWRILVQEMVHSTSVELLVGLKRDPVFGPVVVVGAGGTLVELLPDKVIATCPVSEDEAADLLRGTVVGTALSGYRGGRDSLGEIARLVAAASRLPDALPGLSEADLNPVVITDRGPIAVDARAVVGPGPAEPAVRPRAAADLTTLLEPQSVLVVGASASGAVLPGNRVLGYLRRHGYTGRVVVAHPTATEIDGYPAVPLDALREGGVATACIAVPAASCAEVIDRCGVAGVRAAVVLSSGFSEVGDDRLEWELADTAERHGIVLAGPNTVGVMSPDAGVHLCFSQAQDMREIPSGGVALVTQSGALGGSLASQAWERGIGVSRFLGVGNQAALDTADYIRWLADDDRTRVIAVLLEGVSDGQALLDAVRTATRAGKPVVVMKVGRSEVGARAVASHTGSIAGDHAVYRAVLNRAGAVLVDTVTEMLDVVELADRAGGIPAGARIGIVSTSGGACSVVADLCERHGFDVPTFGDELQAGLAAILPGYAAVANPVDVTGRVATDPAIYGHTLEAMLASDEVDAVAVLVTTVADPMAEELATEIARQVSATEKPVLATWTIAEELAPRGLRILRDRGIPVFGDPARAVRAARLAGRSPEHDQRRSRGAVHVGHR